MQINIEKDVDLSNNKIFELMDCRFSRKNILYEHLHNSYNELINNIINYFYTNDNIFDENRVGDLIYRYKFKYENINIRPPLNENEDSLMYPKDARDKSATYSIKFMAKITQLQEIYDLNLKKINEVKIIGLPVENEVILRLPCMVRSKYCSLQINRDYNKKDCEYDPGGYFIVNGSEKFVLSQEKMVENKPLVFIKKDIGFITYKVKVNSRSHNPNIMMQGIEICLEKNYGINIKVPILNEVSVFILMRALGLETDKEIVKYIVYNENDIDMINLLKISIDLSKKEGKKLILNKEDSFYSLTNKIRVVKKYTDKDRKLQYEEKKEHLKTLLRNAFLPHINSDYYNDVLKVKAYFLGYMIHKLLNCYLGRTEPDDRDSFVNKRIDMPGDLIFDLVKQNYKKMLNDCNKFHKKRSGNNHENPLNIINQIKPGNIEQGIKSAMMTGNWGKKKGVAQMYPRLTFLQSLSFLRRIDAPGGDSSTMKLTGPRHYHPSQVGFLCLTGDTEILMANGTIKLIKDLYDNDSVITINTKTMENIITPIKNWFVKNCKKLFKITTISGRIIKCTPEHKLLTKNSNNEYSMIEIEKLKCGDSLLIKHTTKYIKLNKPAELLIMESNINKNYIYKLQHLLNKKIEQSKLELLARLIGFFIQNSNMNNNLNSNINSDIKINYYNGYIFDNKDNNKDNNKNNNKNNNNNYTYEFIVDNKKCINNIIDDIKYLEFNKFDNNNYIITKLEINKWKISIFNSLGYLLYYLLNEIPEWITNSNNLIQKEFISGLFGNIMENKNKHCYSVKFTEQLQIMLDNFNIKYKIINNNSKYNIEIINTDENLNNYYDVVNLRYSNKVNYKMIEYIKYKNYISKFFPEENILTYDNFIQNININDNILLIKIKLIEEIPSELVYDFETLSNTHNFIASSFISSNCSVESPEHSNIGLVKHLSLLGSICIGSYEQANMIYNLLTTNNKFIHINNHSPTQLVNQTKVFLNGEWIGMSDKSFELYNELRKLKQNGIIIRTNSITHDIPKGEIKIYTDSGRLFRPLLTVTNNKIILTDKIINSILYDKNLKGLNKWNALIEKYPETIDFVDMEEQYYMLVSDYKDKVVEMKNRENLVIPDSNSPNINRYDESMIMNYTHCEFHPIMTIGIIAGNIPFANHNQGPRNIFQYAQGRQSMGFYSSNYRDRLDISYILYNTQKPLVNTKIAKYVHTDILPCGEQAVVALACYSGHNQDDSIVFNQTSIDRGLFRSISLKKWTCKIEKNQTTSQDDIFMKPDVSKLIGTRHAVYEKLNDKGYVPEETLIENGDVIIGKVTPIQPAPGSNKCFKDSSEIYKSQESAIIDRVFTGIFDNEGYEMIKIRTRSERIPKIGDKFCCYTSDHDVLTSNGWKKINEITLNDKIACLINNDTLQYQNPTEIQEYDYEEQLYYIKSNQIDLVVTPNHRMYVGNRNGINYKIHKAKDIYGKRLTYKKNVENYNPINPMDKFKIPGIEGNDKLQDLFVDIEPWLTFFGIWIAEGCTLRDWGVSFATHKKRVKDALEEVCLQMKLSIHKHKDKLNDEEKNAWCISDKRLVAYFKPLSIDAVNKSLPDWVWNLTLSQCQTLIKGMLLGDGHTMINGTCRYDTSSTKLADDFQKLCLHAGFSCNKLIKYKAGHKSVTSYGETIKSTTDAYRLTIITAQNNPLVNKNIKANGSLRHDSWINFNNDELANSIKNKVFCCTVPGDGIIYVRRNGYVSWSGQSRHGQKGTIGLTLSQSDMMFTKDGISPDLIVNPQAFPSRMTVAHLIECLFGKVGAIKGMEVDGTSFNEIDIEKIKDLLENLGFDRNGTEYMYNGITGQRLQIPIFIGPTYYQRLKHLVMDKMHSRARGPITMLTHQPPEGRSKDGGLRCGEMERDSLISYGMSKFLKERFLNVSDSYSCYVCDICGLFAQRIIKKENKSNPQSTDTYECISCKNRTKISKVIIPYAFKLLVQELLSMNIAPRIRTLQHNI